MKRWFLYLVLACSNAGYCQNQDSLQPLKYYGTNYDFIDAKAVVYLRDNSKHKVGRMALIRDSLIVYNREESSSAVEERAIFIPVREIRRIRVRRDAFLMGAVGGVVLGYLAGYGVGYISYPKDDNLSTDSNEENRKDRGFVFGVLAAVPVGIITGAVSSVFTKRNFMIDGNRYTLEKLFIQLDNQIPSIQ